MCTPVMLTNIIRFSLRSPLIIIAGAVLIIIGGIAAMRDMDIDVFPDLTAPTVVVMTDCHGMAAEEVERIVTFPIETAVNGATNVRRVRSSSLFGYSFVWAEFAWGVDIYRARQIVSEKMSQLAEELPEGITPVLAPQSSVMGEILMIGLQADSTSLMELRTIADWVIKPAILSTGGVSQVSVIGGEVKQYHIIADPQRMAAYGVTMDEVRAAGRSLSSNSIGGVARDWGNEYAVRGIARTTDLNEIARTPVAAGVTLADVARVTIGAEQPMGHASQDAHPAVILAVSKQPDINTLNVTENIEANLIEIAKTLPKDVTLDTHIFRQADFISSSVGNVGEALVHGAILAVIVLIVFLASYRTTIISVIAIPLSLLGTFVVLWALGMDINTMTLGGMCIAIGSLVDDAIIDVENVYKRLRENHRLPREVRRPVFDVVFEGSKEIRSSIFNATLIIMVAFFPLFFLSGMEGRMLKPLGLAFIIALAMSLIVAMTVTPLLCYLLLSGDKYLERNERDSRLSSWLSTHYIHTLRVALHHKGAIVGCVVGLFVVVLILFGTMGRGFLPDFNEGSAVVTAVVRPGVSLDVSDELGYLMEEALLSIPEVTGTARRTGRGDLDEHSQSTNSAEIDVQFTLTDRTKDELFDDMRAHLSAVPGVAVTIGQPLGHRIDHILSGTKADIAIKIFGSDLTRLYMLGNSIGEAIEDIEGIADVSVEQQVATPQLQIRANREALTRHGITIAEFNDFVTTAYSGEVLGSVYEGQRTFAVVLKQDGASPLINGVPITEVADIVSTGGPSAISRENVSRKIVVSANVSGRDVGSVVADIKAAVSTEVVLPEGYRIEYGGQHESAERASRILSVATIIAIAIIFLLLYGEFRVLPLAAIVMISLPLALIGGVAAIQFTSRVVSIPSIIGFITLFGVATRNGILLISRYNRLLLRAEEGRIGAQLREIIVRGSADRLNPILMTALTSALALIPLVLGGDNAGNEIQSPMAVVVLGGLISSTILNIYVLPIIYEWYIKRTLR